MRLLLAFISITAAMIAGCGGTATTRLHPTAASTPIAVASPTPVPIPSADPDTAPTTVAIYRYGAVAHYAANSELALRLGRAIGEQLPHAFREARRTSDSPISLPKLAAAIKAGQTDGSSSAAAIEVTFTPPGIRIGDSGPHTHLFFLWELHTSRHTDDGDPIFLFAGTGGKYTAGFATAKVAPTAELIRILDLALLRQAPRSGPAAPSERELLRLTDHDFLYAMILSGYHRHDREASREYRDTARSYLTLHLASRTPDLTRLGLMLPGGEREEVHYSYPHNSTHVDGDRATDGAHLGGNSDGCGAMVQDIRLALRRLGGVWRIDGITVSEPQELERPEPPVCTPRSSRRSTSRPSSSLSPMT